MGICHKSKKDDKKILPIESQKLKKDIPKNYPVTKAEIDKLYEYESALCKIKFQAIKNGQKVNAIGTGFFCEINDDNIPFKKALFTNNHVLDKDNVKINKEIEFECMGKKNKIHITEKRKIFTSIELDYTCIEIFDTDIINNDSIFRIDKGIFNKKNNVIGTEILILQYPRTKELSFAKGEILNIEVEKNEYKILHNASTEYGSSGSPLIKRYNNNLILGIHFGKKKECKNGIIINLATPFDIIINNIISQIKSIDIEIIDSSYICKIYSGLNKKFTDLGILITIPLSNSNETLTGILTRYFIEDNLLNQINAINIKDNGSIENIKLDDNFKYSDSFLNATFIEIKNSKYNFIEINDEDIVYKNPILIKYSYSNDSINYNQVIIMDKWGINILYKDLILDCDDFFTNDDYLSDYDSSYSKLALLFNEKIIAIHTQNDHHYDISVNTNIIAKAIKLNFENDFKYIKQRGSPLSKRHIEELKKIGLVESKTLNIFISPPSPGASPIWFLRTKFAWYWTPTKPDSNDITKSNWMIIYPDNNLKVIGGVWNGIKPVPKNIKIIRWLEMNGLKFLI